MTNFEIKLSKEASGFNVRLNIVTNIKVEKEKKKVTSAYVILYPDTRREGVWNRGETLIIEEDSIFKTVECLIQMRFAVSYATGQETTAVDKLLIGDIKVPGLLVHTKILPDTIGMRCQKP